MILTEDTGGGGAAAAAAAAARFCRDSAVRGELSENLPRLRQVRARVRVEGQG